MLCNLVRGPQVCQLFSCYVSPSINKVLTITITYYCSLFWLQILTVAGVSGVPSHAAQFHAVVG